MPRISFLGPLAATVIVLTTPLTVRPQPPEATTPATDAPRLVTMTPDFAAAVEQLNNESFKARQTATTQMQQAFAQVAQAMLTDQNLQSPAAIEEVMRLNAGFSLWLAYTLEQTPEMRQAALQWGLEPNHLSLVSRAFSPLPNDRARAAAKLAAIHDPQSRLVLAALLRDPERDVHLAAMDALWDAPATSESVAALWDRAVAHGLEQTHPLGQMRPMGGGGAAVMHTFVAGAMVEPGAALFHGQPLRRAPSVPTAELLLEDSDIATRMLINYKFPLVAEKIEALLKQAMDDPTHEMTNKVFQPFGVKPNFDLLIAAYKNNAIVTRLYALATADATGPNIGGTGFLWNSQISALAMLVTITGQDIDSYRLRRIPGFNDLVLGSPADQAFAIDKLKLWWMAHASEYATAMTKAK